MAEEIRVGSKFRLDPRYNAHNIMERDLVNLAKGYAKSDPPPDKVSPIPITLIQHAIANLPNTAVALTIANLLLIGFFYVLRPGEYTYDRKNNHPFRLQDVTFDTPTGMVNAATAPIPQLQTATRVLLYFTTQKNGERGQAITHGDTPDPVLSPLKAVLRQVLHLRRNNASPDTPLHTAFDSGQPRPIRASDLTNVLRASCRAMGDTVGLTANKISVRALRSGGCMALLRAGVDPLQAQMMGRWKSWAMLEYLHNEALDTSSFAARMVKGGTFILPKHQTIPSDVLPLVQPYLEE